MTHPSYGFDGEDAVLWELLGDRSKGFYVDVGANDPLSGCVSRSFYDVGWRGVNIEPLAYLAEKFALVQPESVTLCCALSDKPGSLELYSSAECDHWATLDQDIASRKAMIGTGHVPVLTLAEICLRLCPQDIDWLKIDVEGWEDKVIRGGDWEHFQPQVLCIESFVPHTAVPSHGAWEAFILAQGYNFVSSLGLNRFYRRI